MMKEGFSPKNGGLRLSFETNGIYSQQPFIDPSNLNGFYDDFTPSHCLIGEPISTESDLYSSANVHLS